MDLCLVGASNSFDSMPFARYLRSRADIGKFKNYSIGGSSSILAFRDLDDMKSGGFDFCLIDFSVNEILFNQKKSTDIDRIRENLESFCFQLIDAGCVPIILLFPVIEKRHDIVVEEYRKFSRDFNIPIFDMYEILEDITSRLGVGPSCIRETFFDSPNHVKAWVAELCARMLLNGLSDFKWTLDRHHARGVSGFSGVKLRSVLEAPQGATVGTYSFANDFVSETVVTLGADTPLEVPVPRGSSVVGYSADFARTSCYLSIRGQNRVVVDAKTAVFRGGRRHVLFVLPLPCDVRPSLDSVVIEAKCEHDAFEQGEAVFSQWEEAGADHSRLEGMLSIAEIFVRHEDKIVCNGRIADIPETDFWRNYLTTTDLDRLRQRVA